MASDGSNGPKPWTQRQARTVFLRVPNRDWAAVKNGAKTEFRPASGQVSGLKWVELPTPVVAYTKSVRGYASKLMVLEARWQERLAAISPESLRREGFQSLAEFRRYWMARERRRFRPEHIVTVFRVRPWTPVDREVFADALLERLYGEFL